MPVEIDKEKNQFQGLEFASAENARRFQFKFVSYLKINPGKNRCVRF